MAFTFPQKKYLKCELHEAPVVFIRNLVIFTRFPVKWDLHIVRPSSSLMGCSVK